MNRSVPNTYNDGFLNFNSQIELNNSKEILYQKVEAKINLFERCINEVGI